MGNKKTVGLVVLIIGLLVLILSLVYDYLGGSQGIGPNQTAGIIAGIVAAIIGAFLKFKK